MANITNRLPSAWQRVITGIIAVLLLGVGLVSLGIAATSSDELTRAVFLTISVPTLLVGTPFALAIIVPRGPQRRKLVALGVGLLAAGAAWMLSGLSGLPGLSAQDGSYPAPLGSIGFLVTVGAFGLAFYLAYRIVR